MSPPEGQILTIKSISQNRLNTIKNHEIKGHRKESHIGVLSPKITHIVIEIYHIISFNSPGC